MFLRRSAFVWICLSIMTNPALAQKSYDPGASDTQIKLGQTMPYGGPVSAAEAGIFRARDAVPVHYRRCPPRDQFMALADIYDSLHDRSRIRRRAHHISGRQSLGVWSSF